MKKTKHAGSVEADFVLDNYSTAVCSCGWSGDPHIDEQLCWDQLREHYQEAKKAEATQ